MKTITITHHFPVVAESVILTAAEAILRQASDKAREGLSAAQYPESVFDETGDSRMKLAASAIAAYIDDVVVILEPELLKIASDLAAMRSGITFAIQVGDDVAEIG